MIITNTNEKQAIKQLATNLKQIAAQNGPRVPEVERYIKKHMGRQSGAMYYMAQAIIVQQQALKQAEAQIDHMQSQQQPESFMPQQQARPQAAQPAGHQSGGGFLANAAQTALGIGGGILVANAGMALADSLFGESFDTGDLIDVYEARYEDAAEDALFDAGGFDDFDDFGFDDW